MRDWAIRRRRGATEPRRSFGVVRQTACAAGAAALLLLLAALPAAAALRTGAPAPDFTAQAALGGAVKEFDLKAALTKGPVVLYFFPKALPAAARSRRTRFRTTSRIFAATAPR